VIAASRSAPAGQPAIPSGARITFPVWLATNTPSMPAMLAASAAPAANVSTSRKVVRVASWPVA
jgi:hypothetical protein